MLQIFVKLWFWVQIYVKKKEYLKEKNQVFILKIQKRIYTNAFGRTVRVEYYCESCGVTFEERELDAFLKKNHNVDANNL